MGNEDDGAGIVGGELGVSFDPELTAGGLMECGPDMRDTAPKGCEARLEAILDGRMQMPPQCGPGGMYE